MVDPWTGDRVVPQEKNRVLLLKVRRIDAGQANPQLSTRVSFIGKDTSAGFHVNQKVRHIYRHCCVQSTLRALGILWINTCSLL